MIDIFIGALISGLVSSVLIGFAVKHIDHKLEKAAKEARTKQSFHQKQSVAEEAARATLGRVVYWTTSVLLTDDAPLPTEELKEALKAYNEADKRLVEIKREIVAEYYH